MIGTVVQQSTDTIWTVIDALTISGGIAFCVAVVGTIVFAVVRENKDRPLLPWAARNRVEKARAQTTIQKEMLEQDALEVKRMALSHQRDLVLAAIEKGDSEQVIRLGLPAPNDNGNAQDADWQDIKKQAGRY